MAKKGSTKPKNKNNHLTEVLNAVTLKSPCAYNPKEVSAFVLSLFLSEDPKLAEIVNKINKYQFSLTDKVIFRYYVDVIPKGERYLKFTKKSKISTDNKNDIKQLMELYGVSKREASLSLTEGNKK